MDIVRPRGAVRTLRAARDSALRRPGPESWLGLVPAGQVTTQASRATLGNLRSLSESQVPYLSKKNKETVLPCWVAETIE